MTGDLHVLAPNELSHGDSSKNERMINDLNKLTLTSSSPATASSPLTEFHLFPQLPGELRLKIWKLALSTPRVVDIDCTKQSVEGERRWVERFYSSTPQPALLHACQESRFEALSTNTYLPAFTTKHSPNVIYVSFDQDTIQCSDSMLPYIAKTEAIAIQRMILDVRDAAYFGHFHMDTVKTMTNLTHLELLMSQPLVQSWEPAEKFLVRDFQRERFDSPGWNSPTVRIVDRITKEELAVVHGGALVPGWQEGWVP